MNGISTTSTLIVIADSSQVGEARRMATMLATQLGLNETETGKIALITTEAATNICKYAKEGKIILRPLLEGNRRGLEIIAIDKGPGMANIAQCQQDGYSTSGTPGTGLGSIKRLASFLEIYSLPRIATVLLAQVWNDHGKPPATPIEYCAVSIPVSGETSNGDGWAIRSTEESLFILLVDGLGHGSAAALASQTAIDLFTRNPLQNPHTILQTLHLGLKPTRGAAAMVLQIGLRTNTIVCSGIGNISGRMMRPEGDRSFVSQNGIVGHQAKPIQEFTYNWEKGVPLVLCSDGLNTRLSLEAYPGIQARHPGIAAAILYQDFQRERDDSTILVLRHSNQAKAIL